MFSLEMVGRALAEESAGPRALEVFFGRLLRDGFALAASGTYAPFGQVAHEALTAAAPGLDARARGRVLDAFSSLIPHADVRPALERLAAESIGAAALTNGSAETTGRLLRAAGLLGVEPQQLGMVGVHAWDVHGAVRGGLVGGWASRLEGSSPPTFDPPDVTGVDLVEVVGGLLALPHC